MIFWLICAVETTSSVGFSISTCYDWSWNLLFNDENLWFIWNYANRVNVFEYIQQTKMNKWIHNFSLGMQSMSKQSSFTGWNVGQLTNVKCSLKHHNYPARALHLYRKISIYWFASKLYFSLKFCVPIFFTSSFSIAQTMWSVWNERYEVASVRMTVMSLLRLVSMKLSQAIESKCLELRKGNADFQMKSHQNEATHLVFIRRTFA